LLLHCAVVHRVEQRKKKIRSAQESHIVGLQQERTICLAGKTEKIEKKGLQLAEKSAERSTATIEYSYY